MQALQTLLADGIVDEVLGQLKSGKEADVWLVAHNGETVAAKVYKEREFRSFKNNAGYKEGREVRNTRTQRAMNNGSRFGQKASEDAWKSAEADTLAKLYESGARVPKPVLFYEGVLLMEVIVDAESRVAPRLVDAAVTIENAAALYTLVREQAVKMLCADLIHGDLSEFNVLLAHNGPVVIDFPQVVAAAKNSQSEHFFKRDIENVRRFFANADPALHARVSDADEIWRAYVRRDLAPDFVPSGHAPVAAKVQSQGPRRGGQGRGPGQQPSRPANQKQQRGPDVSFRGAPAQPNEPQRNGSPNQGARAGQPNRDRVNQGREPNQGDRGNSNRAPHQAGLGGGSGASGQANDPNARDRSNGGQRPGGQMNRGGLPQSPGHASGRGGPNPPRGEGQPNRNDPGQASGRGGLNPPRGQGQPNRNDPGQVSGRGGLNPPRGEGQPNRNGPNQDRGRGLQPNRRPRQPNDGTAGSTGGQTGQPLDAAQSDPARSDRQRPARNPGAPPPNPGGGHRRRRRRYF